MNMETQSSCELAFSEKLLQQMKVRRTCRFFTKQNIDPEILKTYVCIAGTAPSGANSQPWFFAIVTDIELRKKIRAAAEIEEKEFYFEKATEEFLNDLSPLKTNWEKPQLTDAGALIIVFTKTFNINNIEKKRCYYPKESTGIATGMLITVLHLAGYDLLTHTPSPMNFLNEILSRPPEEKPFLILAVGKRNRTIELPNLTRKSFDEIAKIY